MTAAKSATATVSAFVPASKPRADVDEATLVRRACEGERPAFAELVRRHQGRVRGLLMRLAQDRVLADDLAQEVFLRAYRGLVGFQGRSAFGTWLYRIAYNVYLNNRTRVKRFAELPEDYDAAAIAPETAMSAPRSDLRRDLSAAIETLPERYRAVVVLYYLEEVSYPEIADILSVPLGTVKTHLHRAKKLLRERMSA
ncbi:MAG: sigma-70 family RNA polymerase sigma factor [Myxococcota bacterium]